MSKDNDIQQIQESVSEKWSEFEGLPPYSAEYEYGEFGLAIQRTNGYEVSLHHPEGEGTGKDGYYKPDVLNQRACDTVDEAKEVVEQYSQEPENYL